MAIALLAAGGLAIWVQGSAAQKLPGEPDAELGLELAEKLCVTCHIVGTKAEGEINPDVPTFHEIANKEGRTQEWLAGKIILPNHPMPTFGLSRDEIGHLVAYILSLKKTQ